MKIIFKIIKILIGSFFLLFSIAGVSIIIEDGFDIGMFIFAIVTFIPGILLISSSIKKKGGKDNKKVLDILKPLESSNINEIETNSNSTEKIDFTKKSTRNKSKVKPSYKKKPKTNTIISNNSSSIDSVKGIHFGLWDSNIHNNKEQSNRINRATNEVSKPLSIDILTKTADFLGSEGELYYTSLDSCDCMDFLIRKLPCKHIYKLAIELGEYVVISNTTAKTRIPRNKSLIKEEISKLSFSSKSTLRNLCYLSIYQSVNGVFLSRNTFPFELIEKGFCIEVENNISDYVVLNVRADLINLIYNSNLKNPPKERAITRTVQSYIKDLDEYNMELYKSNIILISLSNNAKKTVRSIFSYLN